MATLASRLWQISHFTCAGPPAVRQLHRDFAVGLGRLVDGVEDAHHDHALLAGGRHFAFTLHGLDELCGLLHERVGVLVVVDDDVGRTVVVLGQERNAIGATAELDAALVAENLDEVLGLGVAGPGDLEGIIF